MKAFEVLRTKASCTLFRKTYRSSSGSHMCNPWVSRSEVQGVASRGAHERGLLLPYSQGPRVRSGLLGSSLTRAPEFKHILSLGEETNIPLSLKRDESWIQRFFEESQTHVYLLRKQNAGRQQRVHMIDSKLGQMLVVGSKFIAQSDQIVWCRAVVVLPYRAPNSMPHILRWSVFQLVPGEVEQEKILEVIQKTL